MTVPNKTNERSTITALGFLPIHDNQSYDRAWLITRREALLLLSRGNDILG